MHKIKVDVNIIGSGITAIATIRSFKLRGISCKCVCGTYVGGEQSRYSQLYGHRDCLNGNPSYAAILARALPQLERIWTEAGVTFVKGKSLIGLVDEAEAEVWEARMIACNIPVKRTQLDRNHLFRSGMCTVFYETPEFYGFDSEFEPKMIKLAEGCIIAGTALRLTFNGRFFETVVHDASNKQDFVIESNAVVLAAGRGNQALIESLDPTSPLRQQLRLAGALDIPIRDVYQSLVCPELRLFAVPTSVSSTLMYLRVTHGDDPVVASIEDVTTEIEQQRKMALINHVGQIMSDFKAIDYSRAIYNTALKVECANDGQGMRPNGYSMKNIMPGAVVAWPTKLTLAPLCAEDIADSIQQHLVMIDKPSGRLQKSRAMQRLEKLEQAGQQTLFYQ